MVNTIGILLPPKCLISGLDLCPELQTHVTTVSMASSLRGPRAQIRSIPPTIFSLLEKTDSRLPDSQVVKSGWSLATSQPCVRHQQTLAVPPSQCVRKLVTSLSPPRSRIGPSRHCLSPVSPSPPLWPPASHPGRPCVGSGRPLPLLSSRRCCDPYVGRFHRTGKSTETQSGLVYWSIT